MKRIFYILFLLWLPLLALAQKQSNDADELKYPVPKSYHVTFSPQGWATFNSPYAVTLDDDNVKVYIVTNSHEGAESPADYVATLHLVECPKVTIEGKRYIPQRESENGAHHKSGCVNPVVLRYDEKALKSNPSPNVTLTVLEADQDHPNQYQDCLYKSYLDQPDGLLLGTGDVPYEEDSERKLRPIDIKDGRWPYHALGTGEYHTYVLGFTQTYGMAFYEVAPGKALPANRAYIEIFTGSNTGGNTGENSSPRFTIEIDDDPTGLSNSPLHTSNVKDSFIRDLWGHPVTTPQRGQVYIKDNHKYLHQ